MKLILMYGLPGSGKSYLAQKLHKKVIDKGNTSVILSTDDFFMVDGEYKWTGSFIGEAHKWNQGRAYLAMFREYSQIIIDNTNLGAWQCYPYVDSAIKHGYHWDLVKSKSKWANDPVECANRNSHNVPVSTIERMFKDSQSHSEIVKDLQVKFGNKE